MKEMSEQEFLDAYTIPDKTPIRYGNNIIGHTVGNNDCRKFINAVIYPFKTSINFKAQDYIFALAFDDEGIREIEVN